MAHSMGDFKNMLFFLDTRHNQLQNHRPQKESSCVYTFTNSLKNNFKLCSLLDKHGNSYQQQVCIRQYLCTI